MMTAGIRRRRFDGMKNSLPEQRLVSRTEDPLKTATFEPRARRAHGKMQPRSHENTKSPLAFFVLSWLPSQELSTGSAVSALNVICSESLKVLRDALVLVAAALQTCDPIET